MAGIYIHIPYCRQACSYCDFHFSTNLNNKADLINSLHQEIDLRKDYLKEQTIQSIYLGGGTPSLLSSGEINSLLNHLQEIYTFQSDFECTLEANPDDLSPAYLQELNQTKINRLSIGIQSFFEEDMKYMHRSHTPEQSLQAIRYAKDLGIHNLSIDLIYGSPSSGMIQWEKNLDITFDLNIPHISCYALTIEPRTILAHQIKLNKSKAPDDHETIRQLEYLMDIAPSYGLEQYEISNFSKPGHRSKHNSSYWKGDHYLGLGPSAHSFNGLSRQWNVANNTQYIQAVNHGESFFESEDLTEQMRYNEYVLTHLRTLEGISVFELEEKFKSYLLKQAIPWLEEEYLVEDRQCLQLTRKGKFIADRITADLFYSEGP